MMAMFTSMARSRLSTEESIATPCSVKAYGSVCRPPQDLEITDCDLKSLAEDIKAIRHSIGKSQTEFALMIGVGVATLRNWEQGRRTPDGPAMALLIVAARNPKAVAAALARRPARHSR